MENHVRRRESFVDMKRKSLTYTSIFIEENDQSRLETSDRVSMKTYLESLKKEKEDWKDYFKKAKKMCEDDEKSCKPESYLIRRADVEARINPDDKFFLDSKPDYYAMVKSVQQYANTVTYLNKLKSDVIDAYDKACNCIEIDNKFIIDEMVAEDLCELCHSKNCNIPHHRFPV